MDTEKNDSMTREDLLGVFKMFTNSDGENIDSDSIRSFYSNCGINISEDESTTILRRLSGRPTGETISLETFAAGLHRLEEINQNSKSNFSGLQKDMRQLIHMVSPGIDGKSLSNPKTVLRILEGMGAKIDVEDEEALGSDIIEYCYDIKDEK
jgi:hypothetical protein